MKSIEVRVKNRPVGLPRTSDFEFVVSGIDKAPEAFLELFSGGNRGKMLVKLS